jgi:magnesium transporter
MRYILQNGKFIETKTSEIQWPADIKDVEPYLYLLTKEELSDCYKHLGIGDRLLGEFLDANGMKFESHEGFDYISLSIPFPEDPVNKRTHLSVYFRENLLLFCCEDPLSLPVLRETRKQAEQEALEAGRLSLERVVQIFFDQLTLNDSILLASIEEQATQMEELLITSKVRNYIPEIMDLRKKLLAYQRYYDQLSAISSAIEENENDLLTEKELRYFRMFTNRTNRLVGGVQNLQNYVSQLREAYQTQVDINQNKVMKLFTVITAIFLPLTLIVGWYGMNFDMPEYRWIYGYPMVIVVTVVILIASVLYFKKNKWF